MPDLVQYQYPANAMLNFDPLSRALGDYNEGMTVAGKTTAGANAANAMARGDYQTAQAELGKVDPKLALEAGTYPAKLQQMQLENEKTTRVLLGGTAQALKAIPDATLRTQALQNVFKSDPRFAAGAQAFGLDPTDPTHTDAIIEKMAAEAYGAQAPLTQAQTAATKEEVPLRQAQTAATNAEVPLREAETRKAGYVSVPAGTELNRLPGAPGAGNAEPVASGGPTPEARADVLKETTQLNAIRAIREQMKLALQYNEKAYGGPLGGVSAAVNSRIGIPSEQERALATQELSNIAGSTALKNASALAGGRMSVYLERANLALAPNSGMTKEQRQANLQRTIEAANQEEQAALERIEAIKNRTMYKPGTPPAGAPERPPLTNQARAITGGGAPSNGIPEGQPGSRSSPVYPSNPQAAGKLPPGTWYYKPNGDLVQR